MNDTIYALSSGALPAAIAIVRLSGPQAEDAAQRLAGMLPAPRHASLRRLVAADGAPIDEALLLRFEPPGTATGEALIEFHLHGGRAVVARLLAELSTMPGLREAEPGEFTRRALLNGRLDLTQAEGLADLLHAETEWQRRAAIDHAEGGLRRQVERWRERLVTLSAEAEAAIDYVGDEEETATDVGRLAAEAAQLAREWEEWLQRPSAELLQSGLRVVLAGPPNSGKSSLFNALAGSDKAIVTPIPGTTRDMIEARIDLGGIPILLIDTAGLRDSDDVVERIGIDRAEQALRAADLLLWLGDPLQAPDHHQPLLVHARADERGPAPAGTVPTSVVHADGLEELRKAMIARALVLLPPPDQGALNRRQRLTLGDAAEALHRTSNCDLVLTAEALRQALSAIDRLSGRQSTEEVLDTLFDKFCLGK